MDELDRVWPEGDYFVFATLAAEETQHMIGARELGAVRDHAWVVNVARGFS
jgi:phosphoglycerate dehydrogenase-like enzyme